MPSGRPSERLDRILTREGFLLHSNPVRTVGFRTGEINPHFDLSILSMICAEFEI
jgi:hypothetical protein